MTASLLWLLLRVACSVGMPGASCTALLDGLPAILWPSTMKPVTETVTFGGLSEVSAAHASQRQLQAATPGQKKLAHQGLSLVMGGQANVPQLTCKDTLCPLSPLPAVFGPLLTTHYCLL